VLLNMASLAHTQQPSDMPAGLAGAAALMHTAPPPGAGDGAAAAAAAAQTVEAQTRSGLVYAQVCRQRRRVRAVHRATRPLHLGGSGRQRRVVVCSGTKERRWVLEHRRIPPRT
jgi:hypothetical protein